MSMKVIEKLLDAVKKIVVNYDDVHFLLYYITDGEKSVNLIGYGNEFVMLSAVVHSLVRDGHGDEVKAIVNSILYKEGEDDD